MPCHGFRRQEETQIRMLVLLLLLLLLLLLVLLCFGVCRMGLVFCCARAIEHVDDHCCWWSVVMCVRLIMKAFAATLATTADQSIHCRPRHRCCLLSQSLRVHASGLGGRT